MNKEQLPKINKIEIDEKTAEPIIVEVSAKDLKSSDIEREQLLKEYADYDFVEKKSNKSIGKQLAMKRLLGIDKDESINKRKRLFKNIASIVFIVFVFAVLAFTAYNDFFDAGAEREPFSWSTFLTTLKTSWFYLLFAVVSLLLCFVLKGSKLSVFCKSMTGKFHFKTCFETGIIGHYYNNVTPLAVGGQPFEIYHLSKHGVHGGVATSLPIATFFLNQFAFVILGITSLALISYNDLYTIFPAAFKVMAIVGLICCMLMPLIVLVFSLTPRIGAALVKFAIFLGGKLRIVKTPDETRYKTMKTVVHNSQCIKKMATRPISFVAAFIMSFLEQLANVSIAYFTLKFFGFDLPSRGLIEWLYIVQICFMLNAAISFIPTPGNSGAADLSFYMLFKSGLAVGLAFPAMVIWRGLSFYSYIVIGFLFATVKKKHDVRRTANANNAKI